MAHRTVKTEFSFDFQTFDGARDCFDSARAAQQRANSVKVCGNTYLLREMDGHTVTSYALAFHGSKIVRYHADGSYTFNMHGFDTNTTRHRMNQFSPFQFSTRQGCQYIAGVNGWHVAREGDGGAGVNVARFYAQDAIIIRPLA